MKQKTDTSGDDQLCNDVAMTEEPRDERPAGNKYYILLPGKTLKSQEDIQRNALQQLPGLQEVSAVDECDVVLVLCIIVSRTGTDIDAALNELNAHSESKPAVFMVLHHTFDPEKIVPDSSRYVTRLNTLTVDCLFDEDQGFLKCVRNDEALEGIKQWLQLECLELNLYSLFETIMQTIWSWLSVFWRTSGAQQDKQAETEKPKPYSSEMKLQFESELLLVLLGMSGSEKTAVGHMIFGREESQANTPSAALKMITAENGVVDERQVAVMYTPDWFGSGLSSKEIKQNIKFCTRLASAGPYAFLLVIPANQFIKEEREIEKYREDVFEEGEKLMLVLTVSDAHEKLKIENHKFLVEKFGNWFHPLNINETGGPQVSELLKKVEKMVADEPYVVVNKL